MSKKLTDVIAYFSLVGFLLAYMFGDRENSRFHLNQGLVLGILTILVDVVRRLLGWIPLLRIFSNWLCGILGTVLGICILIGLISALTGAEKKIPIIGDIKLL